jgi:glycine hydroxymethyltransferase
MADIAHISGLVATGEMKSPFDHCDIVTTTTHKTMRGPRAGIIFYRKNLEKKINEAVFPGLQGGPHENQIAGIATQMRELKTPEFHEYIKNVKYNCSLMTKILQEKYGFTIITGGSDNHMFLIDLRNKGLSGIKAEKILEYVDISVNKNMIPSDSGNSSAFLPNGVRIGTPAITTRGFTDKDIEFLCDILNRVINIGIKIDNGLSVKVFIEYLKTSHCPELLEIKKDVNNFMSKMRFYE